MERRRVLRVDRTTTAPATPPAVAPAEPVEAAAPAAPAEADWHVNNFDLIRLFAALQVVWYHATLILRVEQPHSLHVLMDITPGVPIFFVLSGFLVSSSYERLQSLRRYAIARATRIYPALWACFAVTVVAVAWAGDLPGALVKSVRFPGWILAQLTIATTTPTEVKLFGDGVPNGSLWTIAVEIGFYVCLPILFWIAVKGRSLPTTNVILAGLAVVSMAANLAVVETFEAPRGLNLKGVLYISPLPHIWLFIAGLLAYLNRAWLLPKIRGRGLWFAIGYYVLATTVLRSAYQDFSTVARLCHFASMLLLGLTVLSLAFSRVGLAERVLRGNDISYGVYLYHFVVINVFLELEAPQGYLQVFLVVVIAVALGWLSWLLVEKPAKRVRKWLDARTGPSAPAR